MFLAPALSKEEAQFLYDQKNSEHFRIFAKAIAYLYSLECGKLSTLSQDQLPIQQGRLQGLTIARNLLVLQKVPDLDTYK